MMYHIYAPSYVLPGQIFALPVVDISILSILEKKLAANALLSMSPILPSNM